MLMQPENKLQAVGEAIFGIGWIGPLADFLQVTDDVLIAWSRGNTMPEDKWQEVLGLFNSYQTNMDKAIRMLDEDEKWTALTHYTI